MEKVLNGAEEFSESCNMLKMVLALALYLGTIHFNLALIFFATFFLPLSKALLVFGSLLVLVMIPVDENSMFGRKLSKYICRHICSYFPITLHIEEVEAFRPNQAYVFGYEPHSVNPIGMIALGHSAGFMPLAKTKLLASRAIFYIPFMRHTWTWLGFTSVSKKNFISSLAAGYSCIVVPGGIRETLFMEPGCETDTYKWWKAPGKLIQNLARILKITPLFFWGIYGSPIPFKIPLYVVVGRPIKVEKNPQPTMDQVAKVHNQFVDELQDLFNRHKAQAGYTNLELKII
ncbi:diacylglycerol O-acyltransferase 2D-like isoform X2 [Cajanus cajan]|uniref:diacylglycerol O-acyltransferase 2D-like isoform X2 n=1 Tax=Cajanus cajan TaxID=3821 RepID=UPI00098D8983|nr:diacylglycerol O-acyltransferase 2D-like isoform X2 [Cajanus cajan]